MVAPETKQLRSNLKASVLDGCAFSLMVGMGETYLSAFALALGCSQLAAGFVGTLPLLVGGALQLVSPRAVYWLGSYRKWVVSSALVQALSFLPLVYAARQGSFPFWGLMLIASVYWGAGMASGPAWNAWLSSLVPNHLRIRFFSVRTRLAQFCILLGLLFGGWVLETGRQENTLMQSFNLLFVLCTILRLISVFFLASHTENPTSVQRMKPVSTLEILKRFSKERYGRILGYLLILQFGIHVSSSFFSPFILGHLRFDYWDYMLMLTASFSAKVVAMPMIATLVKRWGARKILFASSVGIAPMPVLWLLSPDLNYLLSVQVLSGAVWGTFELTAFLLLFNEIPDHEQTSVLCIFNFLYTISVFMGAVAGGVVFQYFGQTYQGYLVIFAASSLLRAISLLAFPGVGRTASAAGMWLITRPLGVRLNSGTIEKPVLPSISRSSFPEKD